MKCMAKCRVSQKAKANKRQKQGTLLKPQNYKTRRNHSDKKKKMILKYDALLSLIQSI